MQKLETINKTEILTESEKKETTWTDKSGKKHPATQVKGDKYTGKEAEKDAKSKKKDDVEEGFTSAIAQALVEEFGYELEEETLDEAGNPWANDPAKSAAWAALTPEDQAWLGGADPTDQFILARAPNKGKPATPAGAATKPADASADQAAADARQDAEQSDIAAQQQLAAEPASAGGSTPDATATGAATKPAVDPAVAATREKFKALMDKLEKTGGVSGVAAPAKSATGAATKPSTSFANTGGGAAVGNPNMAKQGVKEDPNEGNEFSGELAKAKASGADEFEVDGNKYPVKETVSYGDDQILTIIKSIKY